MTAFSPARLADRSARSGRHYPWLIVAGMALVVAVNGVLIYFAVSSFTGLATDDPYDKGLAFNQAAAAATAQAARGWQVDVAAAAAAGSQPAIAVAANFRDRAGRPIDDLEVTAYLVRPTSAGHDRSVPLGRADAGLYRATAGLPLSGEWLLTIVARRGTETWQSTQRVHLR